MDRVTCKVPLWSKRVTDRATEEHSSIERCADDTDKEQWGTFSRFTGKK